MNFAIEESGYKPVESAHRAFQPVGSRNRVIRHQRRLLYTPGTTQLVSAYRRIRTHGLYTFTIPTSKGKLGHAGQCKGSSAASRAKVQSTNDPGIKPAGMHFNIWGPAQTTSAGGASYFVTIIDGVRSDGGAGENGSLVAKQYTIVPPGNHAQNGAHTEPNRHKLAILLG